MVAVLALAALTASAALAAVNTTKEPWRTGTSETTTTVLSGEQAVTSSGSGMLLSTIGATNKPVALTWSGMDCTACEIDNVSGNAEGEGVLTFTGVKSPNLHSTARSKKKWLPPTRSVSRRPT